MSDYVLTPEQEELLRLLVDAHNRIRPKRSSFYYTRSSFSVEREALLTHPGWPEDAPTVYVGDIEALDEAGCIRRPDRVGNWLFELTGRGLSHCAVLGFIGEYPRDACIFRKQGATWLVVYAGVHKSIADSIGMSYIAHLLQLPGKDIHAAELRGCISGDGSTVILGSAGEEADMEALRDYRNRLREIDSELDEAKDNHDSARVELLTADRGHLLEELSRAAGLDGKPRDARSDSERARKSTSAAIHRALDAIEKEHKPLGQHLRNSLKIREFLSYRPDEIPIWTS